MKRYRSSQGDKPSDEGLKVLQFKLRGRIFCLEIANVLRVIHFVNLKSVPGMPSYVKSLFNLHGEEMPIIDLAERINMGGESKYTLNTPIILCEHQSKHFGLIVEEVLGVEFIRLEDLQMKELLQDNLETYLLGALTTDYGDILLLNIDKLSKICMEHSFNKNG
ncbi:MAG: hypothetical protein A3C55_01955 [Gammaproteobacteria bacterium RIFCSPHIGHO2_02_FULL_42_13]|nr:MAG: hypothetical protein A3C55_01955 [Gammaproteobacteria bacterium RIFCSPHIGHO2_02_FULL_42_13]OGT68336.1 MAG: hypothetical protein A3H43_01485 [Gammaproteobacteria bacterium RIFCSPLOWO2_02_FULL_42_9]